MSIETIRAGSEAAETVVRAWRRSAGVVNLKGVATVDGSSGYHKHSRMAAVAEGLVVVDKYPAVIWEYAPDTQASDDALCLVKFLIPRIFSIKTATDTLDRAWATTPLPSTEEGTRLDVSILDAGMV